MCIRKIEISCCKRKTDPLLPNWQWVVIPGPYINRLSATIVTWGLFTNRRFAIGFDPGDGIVGFYQF